MRKFIVVFVAVFCINNLAWSQQELRYFKEDNAFYLGGARLSEHEVRQTLSSNPSALEAWKKGNTFNGVNTGMKIATGVLIGVGGCFFIYSLFETAVLASWWFLIDEETNSRLNRHFAISASLLVSGVIAGIMIPITKSSYRDCYSDAANIYNRGLSKPTVSLHIGTTGNGLGFSLKF